jgi:hypothetical protein
MDQDIREASRVKRDVATVVSAPAVQAVRRIDTPMGYWLDVPRDPHEFVRVRTLWVTITLSVLVHVVAMVLVLERTRLLAPFDDETKETSEQLQVRLTAPPRPLPVPAPALEPPREIVAMPKPARAPRPPTPREPPPVIALTTPGRTGPAPAKPAPPAPAPPSPPAESDLWSYMQARRRERGESTAPAIDTPKAEPNASLAANLPTAATGVATPDPSKGGGIFEIKSMNYDDASFLFFGWNKDMGRRTPQLIEVRKGNNSDMQIAVVRKMISIIREHSKEDFVWRSRNRDIPLSARLEDNAALEAFLMHDFGFDQPGPTALTR